MGSKAFQPGCPASWQSLNPALTLSSQLPFWLCLIETPCDMIVRSTSLPLSESYLPAHTSAFSWCVIGSSSDQLTSLSRAYLQGISLLKPFLTALRQNWLPLPLSFHSIWYVLLLQHLTCYTVIICLHFSLPSRGQVRSGHNCLIFIFTYQHYNKCFLNAYWGSILNVIWFLDYWRSSVWTSVICFG